MSRGVKLSSALLCVLVGLSCSLRAQPADLTEKSHQAKELMAAGKYEEAIPLYRELVRALPNNPGLIMNLGLALHMAGHEEEAIAKFETVLKRSPGNPLAELYLGYAYVTLGKPARAIAPLEAVIRAEPDNREARETLAEAFLALDRYDRAAEHYQKLAELEPGNPKVWNGLGLSFEALAQQNFEELGKVAPESAYWLALTAENRLKAQQSSSAFYLYRQALSKAPTLRGAHSALAEIYKNTGHPDWAETERDREKKLGPPDCTRQELECDFLAASYEAVIRTPLKSAEAYYWKTRAYNALALQAFARLAQFPESAELHEFTAKIHTGQRQFRQAAEELGKAYDLSGHNPRIGTELAVALLESDDNRSAEALLERLLRQQPDSEELNYLEGRALLNLQEPAKAVSYLEKAVARNPRFLAAQGALGFALLQTGQPAKAISHLKAALPTDQDGSLHYQLARAYQSTRQPELAKEMLEAYQKISKSREQQRLETQEEVQITPP